MNTPTVTLSLFTPLCLSSSSYFSMTQSVWFLFSIPVLVFISGFPLLPLSFSLLFCCSFTSFCTGLWERPAMAVLLQGTTDMHELLHCYEFTNGSSSFKCLLCECSASLATWQCWAHAPSTLWPGLPKEPPQANSTFLSFLLILHLILTVCQVLCWGIWMKPYLSGVSLCFQCWAFWYFQCWVNLILLQKSHYHYTGSVKPPPLWLMFLFYFAPGLSLCTNARWILLISYNLLLMTWIADNNCVWLCMICGSDCVDQIIIMLDLSSIFISATEKGIIFKTFGLHKIITT